MMNALSVIKCWLQTNYEMKTYNIYKEPFKNCPKIFYNDYKYFKKISKKIKQNSNVKYKSWALQK